MSTSLLVHCHYRQDNNYNEASYVVCATVLYRSFSRKQVTSKMAKYKKYLTIAGLAVNLVYIS